MSEYKGRIVIGALLAVAVAVGLGFELNYYVPANPMATTTPSSNAPPTASSTITIPSSETIEAEYLSHLQNFASRNDSSLVAEYLANATVTWKGATSGFGGHYAGGTNISTLYDGFFPLFTDLFVNNTIDSASPVGNAVQLNGTFNIAGNLNSSLTQCQFNEYGGKVAFQVIYVRSGDDWLISSETWNFLSPFNSGQCA